MVHVLASLDFAGSETPVLNLCRKLRAPDLQQVVVTMGSTEGAQTPQFRAAGVCVVRCPLRPLPGFVPRLWKCLRQLAPDVVVSHLGFRGGLVLAVAAAAGVPVRAARMNSEGDTWPDTWVRNAQRAVLQLMLRRTATEVLGVTEGALRLAGRIPRDDRRYSVVPNGVDVDRFAGVRERGRRFGHPPVLAHVGRAAPEKNRGFLLEIHGEVRRIAAGTRLVLVGPGGTADLEAVDPFVGADPSVRLLGMTNEVERVLADCDVLLLPSRYEGLPGVVLEALAAGVPVLASDLPGLRRLAGELDGLTLLPLEAGVSAWAATALRLARTPVDERDQISDGLRASAYTLERSAEEWSGRWLSRA